MVERILSFPPIIDRDCRKMILGSMPGEESLRRAEYYGNSHNSFWKILCDIFCGSYLNNYNDRVAMLLKNHIAVWDVIYECEREGSLDSAIKNAQPNDIGWLLSDYTRISSILFNGSRAAEYFKKFIYKSNFNNAIIYSYLPSTSPANARLDYKNKLKAWREALL